jgi:MFS family permease
LGALTATALLSRILPVFGRRLTILAALLGSGLSVLGLSLLVPNFSPPTYPAALLLYFLGLCMVLATAPVIAFLQESTPFDFRGRIFGGLSAIVTWSVGLPVLLSATIADFFGTTRVLTLIGLLILALFFYLRREGFMNLSLRRD